MNILRFGTRSQLAQTLLVSLYLCGSSGPCRAQDLSDESVPLPADAQLRSVEWASWSGSALSWTTSARALQGAVKSFRETLADLISSIKGWELVEEEFEYLIRMESDILFDFDSASIRAEAKDPLSQFARVISSYELKELSITGYTDSKGSDRYNDKLSVKRAESVRQFISTSGQLVGWKLTSKGRGERDSIAPNELPNGDDNPSGRQKNRRVELRLKKERQ
jgi:outer membrane protein OmpA-like peptidoglycan-associated protein